MQGFFANRYNRWLLSAALLAVVLGGLSYAYSNFKMAQSSYPMPTNISVMGEGEATAVPDVGHFSFSVMASGTEASAAQAESGTKINAILAYLKEQGVAETDIKTRDYTLSPRYTYGEQVCAFGRYCPPLEPVQSGFDVSQTIEVKVRDTAKAGGLIAGVGEKGATNISGLSFVVDDEAAVKAEARSAAIADAKAKVEKLAADLGVEIVRMTSFYENEGYYAEPYYAKAETSADAGAFEGAQMPMGENITTVQVNLTYEVK